MTTANNETSLPINFDKITEILGKNYTQHGQNVKDLLHKKGVVPLSNFYECLDNELKTINDTETTTPSKERGCIEEFAKILEGFDTYPANLQKPKKSLVRANSTLLRGSVSTTALSDSAGPPINTSSTSLNLSKVEDTSNKPPKATDIYSDFQKFQQKLRRMRSEADEYNSVQSEYVAKLRQLSSFAQQLEKLLPTGAGENIPDAFTADEQLQLQNLAQNIVNLNFVREHSTLFAQESFEDGANFARLEVLIEVLTYALQQIN